ncbi:helicase associated domain-containing protein [Streptomyces bobili]|uniref:helicase associated domain-containing protein n=1 Tax=Streptomyces bobili TaxID=67280 RepID=UPI0036EF9A1A
MDADRVAQLESSAWSGRTSTSRGRKVSAARGWAAEAGHLLAPLDATFQGYRLGIWLKNVRAAARKAQEIEQRRAEGLPVESAAGALSEERREQLEDIDPAWCPTWPVEWQRAFHLVRQHLEAGGELPGSPGQVMHRGEDLGRWARSVRYGWDKLTAVQQWMCEHILGIKPATEDEKQAPRRRWWGLVAGWLVCLPRPASEGAERACVDDDLALSRARRQEGRSVRLRKGAHDGASEREPDRLTRVRVPRADGVVGPRREQQPQLSYARRCEAVHISAGFDGWADLCARHGIPPLQ